MNTDDRSPGDGDHNLPSGSSGAHMVAEASLGFAMTALQVVVLTSLVGVTLWFSYAFGFTIYQSYFQVPEEVEVPAISGKNVAEAYRILESVGLKLQVHESRHEKSVPDRVVISQTPSPGRKVRKDRAVLAVVSLGPELIDVPDLRGKSLRESKIILSNHRLRLGKITYKPAVDGQPEQVVNQRPGPNDQVRKGESVNLQVQKGAGSAMIEVPSWQGKPLYRLDQLIAKANLELDSVAWVHSDFVPRGEVLGQFPGHGEQVKTRSEIALEVSAGPAQKNLFKQKKMKIDVPTGNRSQEVAVVLNSEVGASTVFKGLHMGGDSMELLVAGFPGSEIEVYINDTLERREKL